MVKAERAFLSGDVVSENQIHLEFSVSHSCDRGDCVVWFAVGFGVDKLLLVRVTSPRGENFIRQFNDSLLVFTGKSDYAHRPFNYSCVYIVKTVEFKFCLNRSLSHCKFVSAALEVFVSEYRAADYRQVCI